MTRASRIIQISTPPVARPPTYLQVRWFKNSTRRDEVKLLMQVLSLPTPSQCASSPPLPSPHREEEAPPPPQAYPLEIKQVEDTAGKAVIREASTHPLVVQASLQPQTQPPPQADDLDAGADDNVGADNIV